MTRTPSHNTPHESKSGNNPAPYLSALSRSSRLQVIQQLTKWRVPREVKKTAIYHDRKAALLHALLHLVPVGAVLTLIILNLRTTYVGPMTSTGLTAIQFASKILEMLIQASITTIVLAFVRHQVLGPRQYPFGGFFAPFRTTDLSYLWSLELWGSLTSDCIHGWHKIVVLLFIPSAIVLAALVGPSSAVLMIPRMIIYTGPKDLIFLNPSTLEYPQEVELANGRIQLEAELNQTIYQSIYGDGPSDTVQITDQSGVRSLEMISNSRANDQEYFSLSSTVPTRMSASLLSSNIARGYSGALGHASQPYSHLHCYAFEVSIPGEAEDTYVDFGPEKPYLRDTISFAKLMPNFTKITTDNSFATFGYFEEGTSGDFSAMAWHRPPPTVQNHSSITVLAWAEHPYREWSGEACTLDVLWIDAKTDFVDAGPVVNENASKALLHPNNPKLIMLSPDWILRTCVLSLAQGQDPYVAFLEQEATSALALSALHANEGTPSVFTREDPMPQNETRMSKQQYTTLLGYWSENRCLENFRFVWVYTVDNNWTDPASLAQMTIQLYQHGYGYDSKTVTVRLSLTVLIIYVSATAAYLLYTFTTGTTATSWDSVAELVTLALNSRSSGSFENTSVGIDTLNTFRRPLSIRVNERLSVEMVFAAESKGNLCPYSDVVPNKKY